MCTQSADVVTGGQRWRGGKGAEGRWGRGSRNKYRKYKFLVPQLQQFRALKLRCIFGNHSNTRGGGVYFLAPWGAKPANVGWMMWSGKLEMIAPWRNDIKEIIKHLVGVWWTCTANVHFTKQSTKHNYMKLVQLWRISILALAQSTF